MEPVVFKYGKLATKYPWIYDYFYSVVRNLRFKPTIQQTTRVKL